jgi:hypothetical protein
MRLICALNVVSVAPTGMLTIHFQPHCAAAFSMAF